ncbi:hypothetical protein B4Q13_19440, partial [Lacticaseibacillus rhamnosus]
MRRSDDAGARPAGNRGELGPARAPAQQHLVDSPRVQAAIDSGDPELSGHFRRLAAKHLEVLAGDLGAANFGLGTATWNRLAQSVDLIVHAA